MSKNLLLRLFFILAVGGGWWPSCQKGVGGEDKGKTRVTRYLKLDRVKPALEVSITAEDLSGTDVQLLRDFLYGLLQEGWVGTPQKTSARTQLPEEGYCFYLTSKSGAFGVVSDRLRQFRAFRDNVAFTAQSVDTCSE